MGQRWFESLAKPQTQVYDFSTDDVEMGIEYTTAGNIILDIEDNQKRIKLTLTQDAVLEICKQQLTMLQGGLHAE